MSSHVLDAQLLRKQIAVQRSRLYLSEQFPGSPMPSLSSFGGGPKAPPGSFARAHIGSRINRLVFCALKLGMDVRSTMAVKINGPSLCLFCLNGPSL
eukprot:scaffold4603_cov16-Tisochrysis_lutea.AAC.1